MKYLLISTILIFSFFGNIQAQFEFTTINDISHTAIKNQCNTGTCWSFSTISFLESEALRIKGKEVDLSEMFIVKNIYKDKALNYVSRQGNANFSDGSLAHDVINVLEDYGVIPEDITTIKDPDYHDHSEVYSLLKGMLSQLVKDRTISENWKKAYDKVLDVYFGETPISFDYENKNYMASQFAKELGLSHKNYISLTSFSHHPFYSKFILAIPDNYSNGSYYNIPLDEMEKIVDDALEKGYTIAWDGDVSEKFFSSEQGIAVIPEKEKGFNFQKPVEEKEINEEMRMKAFQSHKTTDDHLMHIVGTAKDQKGNIYYIVKNSWGEKGIYKGYIYMSKAYFRYKTISVLLHKDVIPEKVKEIE